MCRDDYWLYKRPAPREVSAAGYPIFRMKRIVVSADFDPQLEEVKRQAELVRDHLLATWKSGRKVLQLQSLGGNELNVTVLREPKLPFSNDLERDLFDGAVLCLTLDSRVVINYGVGGFELFDTFDAEDVEVMAPRILRVLAFNCQ